MLGLDSNLDARRLFFPKLGKLQLEIVRCAWVLNRRQVQKQGTAIMGQVRASERGVKTLREGPLEAQPPGFLLAESGLQIPNHLLCNSWPRVPTTTVPAAV